MTEARSKPRTTKGEETRKAILAAAATRFAEQGYHATTVPDIVEQAGVGHGTFYEYFGSRRAILLALADEANDRQRRPQLRSKTLVERIGTEVRWYLNDHVEHLTLSKVWHDAAHFDEEIADARRRERRRRVQRVRKGIEAAGLRDDIDPAVAAAALNAMLEEFARRWFVEGDGPGTSEDDVTVAAETLTTMWLAVLGVC